ncbi:MAG TPA: GntR family transcriptional regulator [Dermatophilaceae bacterium]|nr:GntR family transcriptional regulator [Dermatophilaceae bacterium]
MTSPTSDRRLRPTGTLAQQVSDDVRNRIGSGEFAANERLPSETALAAEYGVSRVTVRTALRTLESQGLIDVRHGSGSFVAGFGTQIRAGIQELRSMSETIRAMGHTPGMQRHSLTHRRATPEEEELLRLASGEAVLHIERMVLADRRPVAFSYDTVPARFFPPERAEHVGEASLFDDLDAAGIHPVRASAEIHAVVDPTIGWGSNRPKQGLYILLDQLHVDRQSTPVFFSKTYFAEGRFQFVVLRTR